jgi:hypothetical protein
MFIRGPIRGTLRGVRGCAAFSPHQGLDGGAAWIGNEEWSTCRPVSNLEGYFNRVFAFAVDHVFLSVFASLFVCVDSTLDTEVVQFHHAD